MLLIIIHSHSAESFPNVTGLPTLTYGQPNVHYHVPQGQPTPAATGMPVDTENRSYTATAMGVQVADQLGRINQPWLWRFTSTSLVRKYIGE